MSKLWIILKTQFRATMGANRDMKAKDPKQAGKRMGYTALMVFVAIIMIGVVTGFSYMIAESLAPVGLLDLLPAVMMTAACIMALITTIYKTNGLLFGFRDYDLVMSLPIKTSTIIISRMLILYGLNILFTLALMVPSTVVYCIFASPPPAFYPVFILCLIMVPMIPIIIATVIGSLIAFAASHFKRKSGMNVVFTVIVLLVWMVFCMNMNSIAADFANIGQTFMDMVNRIYPLAGWYTEAVCGLNMVSFALFALVSLGAYALFVAVVAKNFKSMNAAITANRTTSDYKMQELKATSPKKALFKKEWKRFSSSSAYVMNTAIGIIMLTIVCVLIVVMGAGMVMEFLGFDSILGGLAAIAPLGIALFVGLTYTTACSISLEGNRLWIIKTLPVNTKDILWAKIKVNLVLVIPAVIINATLLNIALKPDAASTIMMYVTPIVYGFFISFFGMQLNLAFPVFNWESEVAVIKRGTPVMLTTLIAMAITLAPLILAAIFGQAVVYIATAALAIVSIFMYRSIMTKGVKTFDAYEA